MVFEGLLFYIYIYIYSIFHDRVSWNKMNFVYIFTKFQYSFWRRVVLTISIVHIIRVHLYEYYHVRRTCRDGTYDARFSAGLATKDYINNHPAESRCDLWEVFDLREKDISASLLFSGSACATHARHTYNTENSKESELNVKQHPPRVTSGSVTRSPKLQQYIVRCSHFVRPVIPDHMLLYFFFPLFV